MDASNIWTTTTKRANNIGAYKLIMKPPKLKPNETGASFRARVKKWEKSTGKKYPRTFAGKTNEERVLAGSPINSGLNKKTNYNNKDYDDQLKEYETNKTRKTQSKKTRQDFADEKKESTLENLGKTDFSKVKLPEEKKKNINEKVKIKKAEPIGKADDSNKTPAKPIGKTDEKSKVNNLTIKKKKKKMHSIEKRNREIFNDRKVDNEGTIDKLKIRHAAWKKARKEGKLKEWEKKYKRK
jgi:hypothetical protein